MSKSLISIVIPCLDEEENVERTYRAICDAIEKEEKYDFEFIFTDNHSSDNTFEVLRRLSAADSRIHAVRFSKNFGYQMSIFTGYMQATGDAAIQLDADLQDPPYLISEFLRRWEDGYKVVYGIRKTQKANAFLTLMTEVFYWLLDKLSESRVPHNAGECRLIDRAVIDALGPPPATDIYIRGRIAEIGFHQIGVLYERQNRSAGETKFRTRHLLKLSVDAIASHSTAPLRLATFFGLGMLVLSILGSIGFFAGRLLLGQDWPAGFATIVILILVLNGFNLVLLGIMGEYIGRIHRHLKSPPETIIEEQIPAPANRRK